MSNYTYFLAKCSKSAEERFVGRNSDFRDMLLLLLMKLMLLPVNDEVSHCPGTSDEVAM